MEKRFLIDQQIVFYPRQNMLLSLAKEQMSQTLNAPCARCLETLLENKGEIVSHETLYEAGWGESFHETSPNTLYQNILLARKALKEISESDENFIITAPRKGFYFNKAIKVEVEISPETENLASSPVPAANVSSDRASSYSWPSKVSSLINRYAFAITVLMFLSSAFFFTLGAYKYLRYTSDDIDNSYIFVEEQGACQVYLSKNSTMQEAQVITFIQQWPVLSFHCDVLPDRYISAYLHPARVFFLACDKSDKAERKCKTGFIRAAR